VRQSFFRFAASEITGSGEMKVVLWLKMGSKYLAADGNVGESGMK
jgi:hypothetical protein